MQTVKTLIDDCVLLCGSQSELARRMGIRPTDVSVMQSGKRPITAATVGLLCDVLELPAEDARRLAVTAVIDGASGEKKIALARAFFRALVPWSPPLWQQRDAFSEQRSGVDRRLATRH